MKPSPLLSHRKSDDIRLMPQHFLQLHQMHLQGALLLHMSLQIPDISKMWGEKSRKKSNMEIKNVQQHYRRVTKLREEGRERLKIALRNMKKLLCYSMKRALPHDDLNSNFRNELVSDDSQ